METHAPPHARNEGGLSNWWRCIHATSSKSIAATPMNSQGRAARHIRSRARPCLRRASSSIGPWRARPIGRWGRCSDIIRIGRALWRQPQRGNTAGPSPSGRDFPPLTPPVFRRFDKIFILCTQPESGDAPERVTKRELPVNSTTYSVPTIRNPGQPPASTWPPPHTNSCFTPPKPLRAEPRHPSVCAGSLEGDDSAAGRGHSNQLPRRAGD